MAHVHKKGIDVSNGSSFLQQLEGLKALKHENILRLLEESDAKENKISIVTPLCEINLREFINFKILCLQDIWRIGKNMLDGLNYLHTEANIPHGSLKPRNILRIDGVWKLAHFGLVVDRHQREM